MDQQIIRPTSRLMFGVMLGILTVIIVLGVFWLGVSVGSHRSRFACQWGERYGAMMGMPDFGPGNRMGFAPPPGGLDPNGADGEVVSKNGREIIVKGRDGVEKSVVIPETADVRKGRENVKPENISVNDMVVVFGSPTGTGQVEAKLIRIFDRNLVR